MQPEPSVFPPSPDAPARVRRTLSGRATLGLIGGSFALFAAILAFSLVFTLSRRGEAVGPPPPPEPVYICVRSSPNPALVWTSSEGSIDLPEDRWGGYATTPFYVSYGDGTLVKIIAYPKDHLRLPFVRWEGSLPGLPSTDPLIDWFPLIGGGAGFPCPEAGLQNADHRITAFYEGGWLGVHSEPTGILIPAEPEPFDIVPEFMGQTLHPPQTFYIYVYHNGVNVTLTAPSTSPAGPFAGWEDGSTANPRSLVINGNRNVKAFYGSSLPELTLISDGVTTASIQTNPQGTLVSGSTYGITPFSARYGPGVSVQVVAAQTAGDNDGYEFQQWDDGTTSTIRTVLMDASKSLTAIYAE